MSRALFALRFLLASWTLVLVQKLLPSGAIESHWAVVQLSDYMLADWAEFRHEGRK